MIAYFKLKTIRLGDENVNNRVCDQSKMIVLPSNKIPRKQTHIITVVKDA